MTRVTEHGGHGIYIDNTGPHAVYDCGTGYGFASLDDCKSYLDMRNAIRAALHDGFGPGDALRAFADAIDAVPQASTASFRDKLKAFRLQWA